MPGTSSQAQLVIRLASKEDAPAIRKLCALSYPEMQPYSEDILRAQVHNFPDGQFVAVYQEEVVGYCATIRVSEENAFASLSWSEVTGGGYGSTHVVDGPYLYGLEVFVNPEMRGLRIGQRLYKARRNLCIRLHLRGIVFAGRMPKLHKRLKKFGSAEAYLTAVKENKIKDPIVSFQMRNGFEVLGVIPQYLPSDLESLGYGAHMIWKNPDVAVTEKLETADAMAQRYSDSIRVATVQYMQRGIKNYEEFCQIVEYFVDVVAAYKADFVVFPEFMTLQLLSIENEQLAPEKSIDRLSAYTEKLIETFSALSIRYNVNIIAGSHPTRVDGGKLNNISYVFLRDGSIHSQVKIHPTPNEAYWWGISGGDKLSVIDTDCGPIGILICYDSEFPELARHLVDQGALVLFVPFCTDERQSYLRVRYSCQARAVENQIYVVMSGNVGNLPRVYNMDIQYAQSCILTPCDFPFARDGVAADTTPNVEMVAFADLHLDSLLKARESGTVRNLKDRRHDLYRMVWKGE